MSNSYSSFNRKFPQKLWQIVNECVSGSINWGKNGKTILIDVHKFKNEFLNDSTFVFKTKHFESFRRQLNQYGFRKCHYSNDIHEFKNEYFIRDRPDLLKFVNREPRWKEISLGRSSQKTFYSKMAKSNMKRKKCIEEKKTVLHGATNSASMEHNGIFNSTMKYKFPFPCKMRQNPFPLRNFVHPRQYQLMKDNPSSAGIDFVSNNAAGKPVDGQQACNNSVVYSKIVFVPAPAYHEMYSGYYIANMF